ncbi:hypothetical protein [Nitrospira sp. Nam74]
MQSDALKSLRVAINGGSIDGLCAGVSLHGNGAQVDIYEWIAGPHGDVRGRDRCSP